MSVSYATVLKGLGAGAAGLIADKYLEAMATELSQGFTTNQRFDSSALAECADGIFGLWVDSPTLDAMSYNVGLTSALTTTSVEGILDGTNIFEIPKQYRPRVRLTNVGGYIHFELVG